MADVFISYSSKDRELAEALARDIQAAGWSVWWDPKIRAGENYRDVILRELDAAKAVVVVWTKNSVKSEWVISEAGRAMRKPRDRYIAVREDGLDEHDIPPPFDVRHAVVVENGIGTCAAIAAILGSSSLQPRPVLAETGLRPAIRPTTRVSIAAKTAPAAQLQAAIAASSVGSPQPDQIIKRSDNLELSVEVRERLHRALQHYSSYCEADADVAEELRSAEYRAIEMAAYAAAAAELTGAANLTPRELDPASRPDWLAQVLPHGDFLLHRAEITLFTLEATNQPTLMKLVARAQELNSGFWELTYQGFCCGDVPCLVGEMRAKSHQVYDPHSLYWHPRISETCCGQFGEVKPLHAVRSYAELDGMGCDTISLVRGSISGSEGFRARIDFDGRNISRTELADGNELRKSELLGSIESTERYVAEGFELVHLWNV